MPPPVFEMVKVRSALLPTVTLPKLKLDEPREHAGGESGGTIGAVVFFEQLRTSEAASTAVAARRIREPFTVHLAGAWCGQGR